MALERNDAWSAGKLYEPYVGRWSRLVAKEFLAWLQVPTGADWLDVGCGTGALTETILRQSRPRTIKGIDQSAGYVEYAKQYVSDTRASFEIGDAQALPVESSRYDAVVSALISCHIPASPSVKCCGQPSPQGWSLPTFGTTPEKWS